METFENIKNKTKSKPPKHICLTLKVVLIQTDYAKCDIPADTNHHMGNIGEDRCTKCPAGHIDQLWVLAPPPEPDTAWH